MAPAFIAALPLARSAFAAPATSALGTPVTPTSSRVSMMAKSTAIPFLEAQPKLAGWAGDQASFDPLGLSNYFDMKFIVEAEIKHCRVAMLAVLGLFVQDLYTLPFYSGAPALARASHDWGVAHGPMVQLLLWVSGLEIITGVPALVQMLQGSARAPGDFGFDPLGLAKDAKSLQNQRYAELVNGRLCMIVSGAIIHHEFVSGKGPIAFATGGLL
jgi:Chlorophyll A-B binding protein